MAEHEREELLRQAFGRVRMALGLRAEGLGRCRYASGHQSNDAEN